VSCYALTISETSSTADTYFLQTREKQHQHKHIYSSSTCNLYKTINILPVYREYYVPVCVHFSLLGTLERGKHGEALVHLSPTCIIYWCTQTVTKYSL